LERVNHDAMAWKELLDGLLSRTSENLLLYPIGSMVLLYVVTFAINIPPMLAYIPYMGPMGIWWIHQPNRIS